MIYKPIIIVAGEPNSIFFEIFFKSLKYKKFKSPIILIASKNLINLQMKKLKVKRQIRLIDFPELKKNRLDNKKDLIGFLKESLRFKTRSILS